MQHEPRATSHQDLLAAPASERAGMVEAYLLAAVRTLSSEPSAAEVGPDSRLSDLAIDSIRIIGLKGDLDQLVGTEVDVELMVGNPTVRDLAERSVAAAGLS